MALRTLHTPILHDQIAVCRLTAHACRTNHDLASEMPVLWAHIQGQVLRNLAYHVPHCTLRAVNWLLYRSSSDFLSHIMKKGHLCGWPASQRRYTSLLGGR